MTIGKRFWILAIALCAALLLAAACGGDDDDADSGDSDAVTSSAEAGDDAGDDGEATPEGDDDGDDDAATPEGDDDDDIDVGGDADGGVQVCDLLTTDEVSEYLGATTADGEEQDIPPFYGCGWTNEDFDRVDVSVTSRDEGGETLYNLETEGDIEDVDDLGDEAHYLTGVLPLLEVLDGGYYVSLSLGGTDLDEAEAKDALISLAEKALDRLP